MTNVYIICLLIIPVLIIGIGIAWYKYPPREIDQYSGYRTKRAMKSEEAWVFAQKYWGKLSMLLDIPLFLTVIVFYMINKSVAQSSDMIFLMFLGIQLLLVILPVPFVEYALKNKFDSQGRPK